MEKSSFKKERQINTRTTSRSFWPSIGTILTSHPSDLPMVLIWESIRALRKGVALPSHWVILTRIFATSFFCLTDNRGSKTSQICAAFSLRTVLNLLYLLHTSTSTFSNLLLIISIICLILGLEFDFPIKN